VVDLDSVAPGDLVRTLALMGGRYRGLVALSTSIALETVRAVLRFECSAFVWKGDEPGDLVAAVVSVASGRTWISEAARVRFLLTSEDRRPVLSPQESRVMRSYGAGTAVKVVALEMRIAEHTVRTYIKRIKTKYLDAGVALESRVDFYRHLDGHDVALRSGRDRMRSRGEQGDRGVGGGGAA
jgi:two-component system nitrate/nitrite response regulator NarL